MKRSKPDTILLVIFCLLLLTWIAIFTIRLTSKLTTPPTSKPTATPNTLSNEINALTKAHPDAPSQVIRTIAQAKVDYRDTLYPNQKIEIGRYIEQLYRKHILPKDYHD